MEEVVIFEATITDDNGQNKRCYQVLESFDDENNGWYYEFLCNNMCIYGRACSLHQDPAKIKKKLLKEMFKIEIKYNNLSGVKYCIENGYKPKVSSYEGKGVGFDCCFNVEIMDYLVKNGLDLFVEIGGGNLDLVADQEIIMKNGLNWFEDVNSKWRKTWVDELIDHHKNIIEMYGLESLGQNALKIIKFYQKLKEEKEMEVWNQFGATKCWR